MGIYLNPGKGKFEQSAGSAIYVDKTGLIAYCNSVIKTRQKYLCVSRPRRFGKSMAAEMLSAYYGDGSDASALFAGFEIAKHPSYETHRNRYDVIFLNMQDFLSMSSGMDGMIEDINNSLTTELLREYSEIDFSAPGKLTSVMQEVSVNTQKPFVILIDEWDCVFRMHKDDLESQKKYLDFLRLFLKDRECVALAYMTGILPVKKYGSHSALNMFREFSMTAPKQLSRFAGFTQEEVDVLCARNGMDKDKVAYWYNGYRFADVPAVYSPQSVVESMLNNSFGSYWTRTETSEALQIYIDLNYDGIRDAVVGLLAGEPRLIDLAGFANDMTTFRGYEDILALLVHLGYLGFDPVSDEDPASEYASGRVFIPNREIMQEFVTAMKHGPYEEVVKAVNASDALLNRLWALDADAVADGVEAAHQETSHLTYNDENALSYTLSLALYAARGYYVFVREMPAGKGYADLVCLPRPYHMDKPALVVELKWDKGADAAIDQIKRKEYPEVLKGYAGDLLLVGISYDKATRKHTCRIEKV